MVGRFFLVKNESSNYLNGLDDMLVKTGGLGLAGTP